MRVFLPPACSGAKGTLAARAGFEVAAPTVRRVLASHRTAAGPPISRPVRAVLERGEILP
jgi:hypothetical protein